MNPKDTIKLDVPLFIRLLEYAREDAKTDVDLHKVAENIIQLSSSGETLGMSEYQMIVGDHDELNEEFIQMQKRAGIITENEEKLLRVSSKIRKTTEFLKKSMKEAGYDI